MKAYLAGPMSNIPQFNFPEFFRVGELLRSQGWNIVSPAELDDHDDKGAALKSKDGDPNNRDAMGGKTWGDFLARDVKLIADTGIEAIIFLPGWETSKGAKLEAMVGLLSERIRFYELKDDVPVETDPREIAAEIYMATIERFTPESDNVN
jgi:hypothetical protein